jgi:broad specificity phosphatase PhoE
MTTLYLVRHGATLQNESRPVVLQGNGIDGPLSETGRRQAEGVAGILSRMPLTHVYSSPLRRARQTAEAIAEPHRLPVLIVEEIHEVDVGQWEGVSWSRIMEEQPEAYARFIANPETVPYLGGESYGDVLRRARPAMLALLSRHEGESIAVVAHNVVNRVLLADLLGLPLRQAKDIRQANCCVNVIRRKNDTVELITMNAQLDLFGDA